MIPEWLVSMILVVEGISQGKSQLWRKYYSQKGLAQP